MNTLKVFTKKHQKKLASKKSQNKRWDFFSLLFIMPNMKLDSVGLLLSLRPMDEKNAVGVIFSRDHGIMSGVMRGALVAVKNKPLVGQVGNVSWNARLDSSLGVFHWEAEKNLGAAVMIKPRALACMNSALDLILELLPEREKYEKLYDSTFALLQKLGEKNESDEAYLDWEIDLLAHLGYALDLRCCSGCGSVKDLFYLSPKTGRAVCADCAAPYLDKVYSLPLGLNTTFRFLENICLQQGAKMPRSRIFLNNKKI